MVKNFDRSRYMKDRWDIAKSRKQYLEGSGQKNVDSRKLLTKESEVDNNLVTEFLVSFHMNYDKFRVESANTLKIYLPFNASDQVGQQYVQDKVREAVASQFGLGIDQKIMDDLEVDVVQGYENNGIVGDYNISKKVFENDNFYIEGQDKIGIEFYKQKIGSDGEVKQVGERYDYEVDLTKYI